jgi:hypothetical protein
MNHKIDKKMQDVWNVARILASSRVMSVIIYPIIFLTLLNDLPHKNKKGFLVIASVLLFYFWLNIILVTIRSSDKAFIGKLKVIKLIFIFLAGIFVYGLMYHALYNYDNSSFNISNDFQKRMEPKSSFKTYFDMTYFSSNILTSLSIDYDIIPNNRIIQFLVFTQIIISILLIAILLSKAI